MNCETGRIYTGEEMKEKFPDVEKKGEVIDYSNPFKEMKVPPTEKQMRRDPPKVEPYELCPCKSGKKFKFCCFKTKTEK